jgi:hypothetical protein
VAFDTEHFRQEIAAATSRHEISRAWSAHFKAIVRLPRAEQLALFELAEARANTFPSS